MTTTKKLKHLAPVLAIAAAAAGMGALLPMAFGMAGMATPLFPLGNAVFFIVMMGGPLLLLASGFQGMAARLSKRLFLVAFTALLVIVGLAIFWKLPGHGLLLDWIAMSLVIALIAAALRHGWLWAVVGGVWTGVLLAVASVSSVVEFLSPSPGGTPTWVPLWLLGCILALSSGIVAFLRRKRA